MLPMERYQMTCMTREEGSPLRSRQAEGASPNDLDPKRETRPKLPISNRTYRRLEFNISPTKQRTGALSNRPKSGVFWTQASLPAVSTAQPPPYGLDPIRELGPKISGSNRQLETIRIHRKSFKFSHITFSNRPKKMESIFPTPSESDAVIGLSNLQALASNLQLAKKRAWAPKRALPRRRPIATLAHSRFELT